MKKIKRHFLHREEYTPDERIIMENVHKAFKVALKAEEVPTLLKMKEDNSASLHRITPDELLKKTWVRQLKTGLLSTKADMMIGNICDYLLGRVERMLTSTTGNPNDPRNLVLLELLEWLTKTLSGAECTQKTLDMVNDRLIYLDNLRGLFPSEDLHEKKMITALDDVKAILQSSVQLTIKREIANTHASEHLESLQELGKIILNLGFEIGYHVFTNVPNVPSANMSRCRKQEPNYRDFCATKLGQLLLAVIQTGNFKQFFAEQYENTPTTLSNTSFHSLAHTREKSTRASQIAANPFLDHSNQLCIPYVIGRGQNLSNYLSIEGKKVDDTGIYPALRQNKELLESYVRFLAILIELAKLFSACGEAKALAGIGGDLLIYGFSNEETKRTMISLKKCCEALKTVEHKMISTCNNQFSILTRDTLTEKPEHVIWVENFKKVHSLQTELEKYLDRCSNQATFVTDRAKMILSKEWLEEAEQQTKDYVQSAMELNHHVSYFLDGKPTPEFDTATLPWNRVLALPQGSAGGAKVELLEDDAEKGNAGRVKLDRTLRTSLKNLFGMDPKPPKTDKESEEKGADESPAEPKQTQLKKGLRTSLKDLFTLDPKDNQDSKGSDPATDKSPRQEAVAEGSQKKQLHGSLRTSLTKLFKLDAKEGKDKSATAAGDANAKNTTELSSSPRQSLRTSPRQNTDPKNAADSPATTKQSLPRSLRNSRTRLSQLFKKGEISTTDADPPAEKPTETKDTPPKEPPGIDSTVVRSVRKKTFSAAVLPPVVPQSPITDFFETSASAVIAADPEKIVKPAAAVPVVKAPVLKVEFMGDRLSYLDDSNVCWHLKAALQGRPSANDIQLQKNRFTANCATELCGILSKHQPLEKLNLSSNKSFLSSTDTYGSNNHWIGAKAVSDLLLSHRKLREAVLIECGLTSPGACALSAGFSKDSCLEIFDISYNAIENEGAISICNAARNIPTLRVLNLAGCSLGNSCTDSIADLLITKAKKAESLEALDLSTNQLGDQAVITICEAAKTNPKFSKLNCLLFGFNKLTDACAPAIYSLLQENPNIINFSVDGNTINQNCLTEIRRLLELNRQKERAKQADLEPKKATISGESSSTSPRY